MSEENKQKDNSWMNFVVGGIFTAIGVGMFFLEKTSLIALFFVGLGVGLIVPKYK